MEYKQRTIVLASTPAQQWKLQHKHVVGFSPRLQSRRVVRLPVTDMSNSDFEGLQILSLTGTNTRVSPVSPWLFAFFD